MEDAMTFRKGDLVRIGWPNPNRPTDWFTYVIVGVELAASQTILGSYEVKAIGSEVSEFFSVWSNDFYGTVRDQWGCVVVIKDNDDYNFDNSSCNK